MWPQTGVRKLDLLTALPYDSWLHLIMAQSLISKLYKSLQHTLGLRCVFTSRSLLTALTVGILQPHRPGLLFTDPHATDSQLT
jgi:hypothetical protein